MNGFVVIVEPEELNGDRIRALLESVERKFDYELVRTAEQALDLVESKKPDVFVGDMNIPVISAEELFSTVKMISPDTVQIALTDADDTRQLINFINECKTYKIIMKPCRLAEDIVKPVEAALAHKAKTEAEKQDIDDTNLGFYSTKRDYTRMNQSWQNNLDDYDRVQKVFADMLACNLKFGNISGEEQQELEEWYRYAIEQYMKIVLAADGNYDTCAKMLAQEGNVESLGYTFRLQNGTKENIPAEQMKKITFILQVMIYLCKKMLYSYKLVAVIENTEKAYILRVRCQLEHGIEEPEAEKMYRISNAKVREALYQAAEKTVDSFGYKTVVMPKEKDMIINIAVNKTL